MSTLIKFELKKINKKKVYNSSYFRKFILKHHSFCINANPGKSQ